MLRGVIDWCLKRLSRMTPGLLTWGEGGVTVQLSTEVEKPSTLDRSGTDEEDVCFIAVQFEVNGLFKFHSTGDDNVVLSAVCLLKYGWDYLNLITIMELQIFGYDD